MSKAKSKNNLNSPLFSIAAYKNFVLVSGGGGGKNYGLPNCLKVFTNKFPLEDKVCEIDFDTELMSHFQMANSDMDYFVAAISKYLAIFKIDPKSGEVSEIKRTEADFHEKEPEVAKAKWSHDNKMIVCGGEEGVMRIFKVIYSAPGQIDGFEMTHELGIHSEGINDVSLSADGTMAVSASVDKTCRIYSLKDSKCIKRLAFSEGVGEENLRFKGVAFSPDSKYLYSLATKFKGRSYVIKWNAKSENFDPEDTTTAHNGPSCALDITSDGSSLAVGTNDGHVVAIDTHAMAVYWTEKKHRMPVSNLAFTPDSGSILSVSADHTYEVTTNWAQTGFCGKFIKLCMFLLFIAVCYSLVSKYVLEQ